MSILRFISLSLFAIFATSATLFANERFDYDPCADILRDGVRDELATSNSMKHMLVKHNQFCSIGKKNKLTRENYDQFSKSYSEQVKASRSGMGVDASIGYGPFSFDADFDQSGETSSLSKSARENLLKQNKEQVLDYFESNCEDSSYQEFLETEAQAISKVANPHIVEAWKQCMVRKHGIFVYLDGNTNSENFGIRVEWHNTGNNYIKELYLQWHGDNINVAFPSHTIEGSEFRQTRNICEEGRFIFSGGNKVIGIHRKSNNKNDLVYVTAISDNCHSQAVSINLPKISHDKKMESNCERFRFRALRLHLISNAELIDLRVANEAPVIVGSGDDQEIFGWIKCNSLEGKG